MNFQKIAFIINPIAGTSSKEPLLEAIKTLLSSCSYKIFFTERRGHATEIAKELLQGGWEKIVAAGGDGTVNETASALINTPSSLGIIPFGSGDGLARHLRIPRNCHKALRWILSGTPKRVDYGTLNGDPFFCTAGVGFDAQVGSRFASAPRRGFSSYVSATLKEWTTYKTHRYTITVDGQSQIRDAFLITVANANQWGNNALIAPRADLQDGLFDVVILSPFHWSEAPEIGLRIFKGNIDQSRRIEYLKGKEIIIERETPGMIHLDGEATVAEEKLIFKIHPGGLRILTHGPNERIV